MQNVNRVLLLEHSPELAEAVADVLSSEADCEVTATRSGKEALLLFARHDFDLVLADLEAGELADLGGAGVSQVVADLSAAPVIAMSSGNHGWQQQAFGAGATACLQKPFGISHLLALVRSLLETPRPDAPLPFPVDVDELSSEDLERISNLSDATLDALPFGLIRFDHDGTIFGFNAYEAKASGYSPPTVVGLRFQDVAPCVKVKKFADALDEVRARPGHSKVLRFKFPRFGATALVSLRLFHDPAQGGLWLLVSQGRAGQPS